jgi:hypothetical protein
MNVCVCVCMYVCVSVLHWYVCLYKCVFVCVFHLITNVCSSMKECMCTLYVPHGCMCWNLDFQWHHPPLPLSACNLHYMALGHGQSYYYPCSIPFLGLIYVYDDICCLKPECCWRGESTWKTSFEKGTFVQREANHLQL